ncbi:hypothetical protein [Sphingorhabdus sp.]|jgi:hypothetical protein|uniref:hypothetical protein n=1 Tax=Sphingorhabdus sp. TaxID=1902408 RepID=UPI003D81C446
MKINFPHHALRKYAQTNVDKAEGVLDAVRARQAKSPTVRSLRRAEHGNIADGDNLAARIHCFAAEPDTGIAVRGSFWQKAEQQK